MPLTPQSFIERWQHSAAAERANYQLFLSELCDFLDLPRPDPTQAEEHRNVYVFEKAVDFHNLDGTISQGRIDLYRREIAPILSAHSLKDILLVGMHVVQNLRSYAQSQPGGSFPIKAEMLAAFACLSYDPEPWIKLVASALMQSDESPKELEATIGNIVVPKAKIAGLMSDLSGEFAQQAKSHVREDRKSMFGRWIALQPPILAVLDLQERYPNAATEDALRLLASQFPGLTRHIELHIGTLETFKLNSSKYEKAKRLATKAQLLASAIVAKEFGVGEQYCLQCLEQTRRAEKGRLRKRD